METATPIPAVDFNFDSVCSSPYMTAPSSPHLFGNFFFSAPTSPSRVSSLHPLRWDQNKPKITNHLDDDDDGKGFQEDFEFKFSGQLERTSLSADELFDCGKIRPLKLPQQQFSSAVLSQQQHGQRDIQIPERGRETTSGSSSGYVHKKTRSLSPLRVTDIMFEQEETISSDSQKNNPKPSYVSSILSSVSFSKVNKKWKLKDLLLFRSASEGRAATGRDPLRKYTLLSKKDYSEDVRNASFRSTDSVGSRRRSGPVVSAHEMHYTTNRAVTEEMKRKTFLPYKLGPLGCLGFNPGFQRGIGSLTRGSS